MRTTAGRMAALMVAGALLATACGGDDASEDAGDEATAAATETAAEDGEEASGDAADGDAIVIGVTVEQTGPVPGLGVAGDGAQLAAEQINAAGGIDGQPIELEIRDNAADPAQAIENVREFANAGIELVIGPVLGQDCSAVAPVLVELEVAGLCVSTVELVGDTTNQFAVGAGSEVTSDVQFAHMATQTDLVGVLATRDESGDEAVALAEEDAADAGIEVVDERVEASDTTFVPQLQSLIGAGVGFIYLTDCGPGAITAAREAIVDLGFEGGILLENCMASFGIAQAVAEFANDQIVVMAPAFMLDGVEDDDPRAEAIAAYEEAGGEPDIVFAAGWDAVHIAAQAIAEAGAYEAQAILDTLAGGLSYTGVWHAGTYSADDHRGAIPDGAIIPAVFTADGGLAPA